MKLLENKILLVGGGTGGHVVPVLEIYKRLESKKKDLKITVVGSGTEIEKNLFGQLGNYQILRAGRLHRHSPLRNVKEFVFFFNGLIQAFFILLREKPKIIFSKGGYVSLPIIFWAKIFKVPYFVHESDVESGLSNLKAFEGAKKIFLGFPEKYYNLKSLPGRIVYSGPVIRNDFIKNNNKDYKIFGFPESRPTIFVTGGSQGSLSINKSFTKIVPELLSSYNIIHQTGDRDFIWVREFKNSLDQKLKNYYYAADFLSEQNEIDLMTEAINLSDLVIARAGANTISELAIKKKVMILVPYKYAAGDHQSKNAKALQEAGGAIVIEDDKLSSKILLETVKETIKDGKKREILSNNAYHFFANDGLEIICSEILKEVNA